MRQTSLDLLDNKAFSIGQLCVKIIHQKVQELGAPIVKIDHNSIVIPDFNLKVFNFRKFRAYLDTRVLFYVG